MNRKRHASVALLFLLFLPSVATPQVGAVPDADFLLPLHPRALGPTGGAQARIRDLAVDLSVPFRVHVALAEDGAWRVPSTVWEEGGVQNHHWLRAAPGDAASILPDPGPGREGLVLLATGELRRYDDMGRWQDVSPWAPPGTSLRFNESAPLARDPFRPDLVYVGSQFVHRTSNDGRSWQIVSGALTDRGSILSLAPSPVQEEVVWAGTTDGRVHLTRSSGGTWIEITGNLPSVVRDRTVGVRVVPSRHHGGTAFLFAEGSPDEGSASPLYRTTDYGEQWRPVGDEGGLRGPLSTLEEDPVRPELLFAGTPGGLYVSFDGGGRWMPWASGLPAAPVASLAIHPRSYDLVVAFRGEGAWVVDDIRPLREVAWSPSILDAPVHLFPPPPAYLHEREGRRSLPRPGGSERGGEARPPGALVTYAVGENGPDSLSLEILDADRGVLRRLPVPSSPGLHRVAWDLSMRPGGEDGPAASLFEELPLPDLPVLPGAYTVRLTDAGVSRGEETLEVLPDPGVAVPGEERLARHRLLERGLLLATIPLQGRDRLERVETALLALLSSLRGTGADEEAPLRAEAERLLQRSRELVAPADPAEAGGAEPTPESSYAGNLRSFASALDGPTEAQRIALQEMEEDLPELGERLNDFLLGELSLFNQRLREAGRAELPRFEAVSTTASGVGR